MITDFIIDILTKPIFLLLEVIPVTNIDIDTSVISTLNSLISSISYIFPVSALLVLFGFKILLKSVRVLIAFIVRVKSFIPTMGA